jgi:REP element-mobilizing transposase RayT
MEISNKQATRKSIRLQGHNYSDTGYYFVTLCVKDRHEMLGNVGTTAHGRPCVNLSPIGQCIAETIEKANKGNVSIDKYVIMPNHIHMIVKLCPTTDDRGRSSLQQVVRNIKSYVTKWAGFSLWQPRFHDHIIRSEKDYKKIWQYIEDNPALWDDDIYHHKNCS